MEISRVKTSTPITPEKKNVSAKKDFSQSFNFARERKNEEELMQMQEEIKKKGNRLIITKCYSDVRAYKNMIKEFLQSALEYMYSVKRDISFWQTQYFLTVETIDKELEKLMQAVLSDEKEHLDIAATVDTITGLVIDIYK